MIREILENQITGALEKLGIANVNGIVLEHPEELSFGDYSSNIAMVLAKETKKNPKTLAEEIAKEINKNKSSEIAKAEAVAGFVNFHLSKSFFSSSLSEILKKKDKYGENNNLNKQKTVIEYTDPNPFKEFHIGHLMSNAIGESISRIVEANGAKVIRACYQGDVGLHVAKTIWGVKNMIKNDQKAEGAFFGNVFGFGRNPRIWGRAYALGATAYEGDELAKKEIAEINKKIYEKNDSEINKIYKIGRKVSLTEFEKIYKILGTRFKEFFFESRTNEIGKKIVLNNVENDIFQRSEGAVIFRGEEYGLHTRVFITSDGLPTYEAKDLGLAKLKYDKIGYEKSVIITGNEQSDYFKVVLKALELLYPDLAKKTAHVSHGMLRFASGKMASRTGNVISALSLIGDIKTRILEKMEDRKMSQREKNETAEKIAVGALKYSILKQVPGRDIIFDFDKSLSFEGDSGPYLDYSYARAKSVLRKAKREGIKPGRGCLNSNLEKILYRLPEIVERAEKEYSPNFLATYLIELSSAFNSFYGKEKIIDKKDPNSSYKVALTKAFSIVLKNGLNLLGISAVERM